MTEYFEKTVTRIGESNKSVEAWAKGEETWGLKNSLFICKNGKVTQYCDGAEAENFHDNVKQLNQNTFNGICEAFFKAVEKKNLAGMHTGLAIFNEMDEFNLGNDSMKRRLMRIRKSTEAEAYKFKEEGLKDFIYYGGKTYVLDR